MIETPSGNTATTTTTTSGGGGFKKGGFKSSFAAVKGSAAPAAPVKRNVLGDDDDTLQPKDESLPAAGSRSAEKSADMESEDEGYGQGLEAYYDPRRPTDCFAGCAASNVQTAA